MVVVFVIVFYNQNINSLDYAVHYVVPHGPPQMPPSSPGYITQTTTTFSLVFTGPIDDFNVTSFKQEIVKSNPEMLITNIRVQAAECTYRI